VGSCYEELDQQAEAGRYIRESYRMALAVHDPEITVLTLLYFARQDAEKGRYSMALNRLGQAEVHVNTTGYRQGEGEVLSTKAVIYKLMGDYRKALQERKRYQNLADSLATQRLTTQTKTLQLLLQSQDKENRIALQQVELATKNRFLIVVLSLLGVVLVLAIALGFLLRARQRQNRYLAKSNAAKDRMFSIISHDLKSPAIAQQLALKMLLEEARKAGQTENQELLSSLYAYSCGQVTLLINLLGWARMHLDQIRYSPQLFDLEPVVTDVLQTYATIAGSKGITINTSIQKNTIVYADRDMVALAVRNVLDNAIKFTPTGGSIALACQTGEAGTTVSIKDSGAGMPPQVVEAIRAKQSSVEAGFGTNGEKGMGIGLGLVRDLLGRNGSSLNSTSNPGEGTEIAFTLKGIAVE
jgi:sensor histidine kinase